MTATPPATMAASRSTLARLDDDWQALGADRRAVQVVAGWAADHAELAGVAGPADVIEALGSLYRAEHWDVHDQVLLALLDRAAGTGFGAEVAWKVVARALQPKVMQMARRFRSPWGFEETASMFLACLYETVRTYPIVARPRRVYTNLALDTLALAKRILHGRRGAVEEIASDALPRLEEEGAGIVLVQSAAAPERQVELALALARAAELHLLSGHEAASPALAEEARLEVLDLLVWAIDTQVLSRRDAQVLAAYYGTAPGRSSWRLDGGAEEPRVRQRRSRALRAVRRARQAELQSAA
ncbi:hypothetical protein [Mangrovactinospora gilvigrisea]|uniref:hypothetical protein n=1 Tax=Mangrovactinospora gilvigrisea TaxID=1428644 RepID=UPI000AEC3F86|nr:hypothetical protein [Mangrovactinospora gilvigrisea]